MKSAQEITSSNFTNGILLNVNININLLYYLVYGLGPFAISCLPYKIFWLLYLSELSA